MTNYKHSLFHAFAVVSLLLPACQVDDADLDNSGLDAFAITAAASSVNVMEVGVSGTATLAYVSDDDATLEIFVNGNSVYVESFDASTSLDLAFNTTLPLSQLGPNDIVATLHYNGNELTQNAVVTVDPAAPSVTFPTWTTAFTQTGTIAVDIDPAWTLDEVAFARDDGPFEPAIDAGSGNYDLPLTNLDVGDNALVVRVTSSNRGTTQVHYFNDTVTGIVPVFDCSNPSSAMLPDTELLERNNHEIRTLVGYFGDPDGGHTYTFLIEFLDDGVPFQTVASVVSQGRTSLMADLDVGRADCGADPCTQNYALSVFVDDDPVPLCSNNNFGIIRRF